TRRSVIPDIAETTTRHGPPPRLRTRRATSEIRSADPTEVPPNLRTSVIARRDVERLDARGRSDRTHATTAGRQFHPSSAEDGIQPSGAKVKHLRARTSVRDRRPGA